MVFKLEDKQDVSAAEETKPFSGFPQWGNFLRQPHQLQKGEQPLLRQAPTPGEDSSVYFNDLWTRGVRESKNDTKLLRSRLCILPSYFAKS